MDAILFQMNCFQKTSKQFNGLCSLSEHTIITLFVGPRKFGIQPLWGKSKRMSKPFFDFRKIRPPGPKNGHFLPFFGHFCSFLDLKIFSESEFFLFFNMMFLGIFRSDLQKIEKKGSKFGPPGPKNGHFWPFFGLFCNFSDLKIFLAN